MQLKDYQGKVIERLDTYLAVLKEQRADALDYAEFQRSRGREVETRNWCQGAWDELNNRRLLPTYRDRQGAQHIASWVNRKDGLERPIPSVCLKVPTGGGKTLLAA